MTNPITRRHALALSGAALAASCVDSKAVSQAKESLETSQQVGTWSTGSPLPAPAQEIYPCAHNGALHLAGGFIAENGRISGPTAQYNTWQPGNTTWTPSTALPVPRHHPHCASFDSSLVAFAGFERFSDNRAWAATATGWMFVDNEWQLMPALGNVCGEAVIGVTGDGALHLAGGRTRNDIAEYAAQWRGFSDTDHHFVLTGLDARWEAAAPCLSKRNSAAGDVIDGNLHVVGGRTVGGGNVATHEVYDHAEDRWRTAAPMPQAQGGLAAAAVGGKLYAFGGEYFDNGGGVYKEAWAYDPATDKWSALPDMPNPRHGLGAVALDGKIYTIGGALQPSGVETSALVEVFTPA